MQAGPEQLADMMDPWSAAPASSYDVPRGSCPRCGSGEVTHVLAGLPVGPVETPSWVAWVGCMPPGHTRECGQCRLLWVHAAEGDALVRDLGELTELLGAADLDDLGGLLSERLELDAFLPADDQPEGELLLRIQNYGVSLQLPTSLGEVREALDDLEEEVIAILEAAEAEDD